MQTKNIGKNGIVVMNVEMKNGERRIMNYGQAQVFLIRCLGMIENEFQRLERDASEAIKKIDNDGAIIRRLNNELEISNESRTMLEDDNEKLHKKLAAMEIRLSEETVLQGCSPEQNPKKLIWKHNTQFGMHSAESEDGWRFAIQAKAHLIPGVTTRVLIITEPNGNSWSRYGWKRIEDAEHAISLWNAHRLKTGEKHPMPDPQAYSLYMATSPQVAQS